MHTRSIVTLALVLALASAPFVVNAREGRDDTTDNGQVAITSSDVERSTKMEERRAEAQAKLEARRAEVSEKLDQKRKERCEKKEARINLVVDKRVVQLQKHLNKFNAIRDRFVQFVTDKQLDVSGASELEATMNDQQVAAQAAVTAAGTYQFSCAEVDASNPGGVAKSAVEAAKTALKDYRTAIKEYARAARAAAEVSQTTPSDDGTADQGSGDVTEGAQQ